MDKDCNWTCRIQEGIAQERTKDKERPAELCVCEFQGLNTLMCIFRPSAMNSGGGPYGVTSASSLSWRTPPTTTTPGVTQSHDHVIDGWGARPLR